METRSKILVAVFLLVSLYLKAAPCPPFGIDCAHIPRSGDVSIQITNTPGSISARVSVTMPSACYRVRGWGTPIRDGSTILAQAEFFASGSGYCAQVIVTATTEYDLGFLEPGRYRFALYGSGQLVKTTTFDVLEPESSGAIVLDPSTAETSYLHGTGAFSVESETGGFDSGSWQAYSLQDWLSISGVSKGPSGSVSYAAQANPSASSRTGHIVVGDLTEARIDLGTPVSQTEPNSPGEAVALRFSVPLHSFHLYGLELYVSKVEGFSSIGTAKVAIRSLGAGGQPGEALAETAMDQAALAGSAGRWAKLDLSAHDIPITNGDFFVSVLWEHMAGPLVGLDRSSSGAGRNWTLESGHWRPFEGHSFLNGFSLMIRAIGSVGEPAAVFTLGQGAVLKAEKPRVNSAGGFSVEVTGPVRSYCGLEGSVDFVNWTLLDGVEVQSSGSRLEDRSPGAGGRKFYRLKLLDGELDNRLKLRIEAARAFDVPLDQVEVGSLNPREWSDACLGCAPPGVYCAQVLTSGFEATVWVRGVAREVHTDDGITRIVVCGPQFPR